MTVSPTANAAAASNSNHHVREPDRRWKPARGFSCELWHKAEAASKCSTKAVEQQGKGSVMPRSSLCLHCRI